jgi:dimethylaniline monooxygenase (N-oxide forming)
MTPVGPATLQGIRRRRVAVIGAGISGLATARCLLEEGLDPVVFEQAAQSGGLWGEAGEGSVLYPSLRTNTSKHTFAFSGLPFPDAAPDYPSWSEVRAYVEKFVAHAGLRAHLRYNTAVESVEPTDSWHWRVRTRTGQTIQEDEFDAVAVCSGRIHDPSLPPFPGADRFGDSILHSSSYRGPEAFAGRQVVVVGVGSSGVDLATEVSQVARRVYLSISPRTWFIPRYIVKRPYDYFLTRLATQLPQSVRERVFTSLILSAYRGSGASLERLQSRGVVLPRFDLYRTRFTPCNPELLQQIVAGAIEGRPPVTALAPHEVVFADGSRVQADMLLCCTGYHLRLPFLSPTLLEVKRGWVDLYQHIFPPHLPNLAFVGMVTIAGSHPPVAEVQARWVARVFAGAHALPSPADMEAAIQQQRAHPLSQNPVPMQVQIPQYTDAIARILGVYPHPWRHPRQAYRLLMGPLSADDYRPEKPAAKR